MGSNTQKWKLKFEELTIVKEALEHKINQLQEQIRTTANVKGSITEVERRRREQKRNARLDPQNPENLRLERSEDQRLQHGSGHRV